MENNSILGFDTGSFEFIEPDASGYQEAPNMTDLPESTAGDPPNKKSDSSIHSRAFSDAVANPNNIPKTEMFGVSSYDPKLKERYKGDPSIYNDFFDPAADNERVAYNNWDNWEALSAGFGGFKENFKSAYIESAYTWARVGKALFNLDIDYLSPSEVELAKMAREQEKMQLENPIFYAPGTEDDFLTKGFLAETFQNLGFTFGTLAELGTEWALTSTVSAGLAASGVGAPAAGGLIAAQTARTGAKLTNMFGKMSRLFLGTATDDAARFAANASDDITFQSTKLTGSTGSIGSKTATEAARTMNAQTNVGLQGSKLGVNLWDNTLKVASSIPFVGQFADATRLIKAARGAELTGTEVLKIGAGALRRSFAEWQMAAGEASIEAGGNYGAQLKSLVDIYKEQNNGEAPSGAALQDIKNLAMQSATADFSTNVAILAISNKIQFGNLLGKFAVDTRTVSALRNVIAGDLASKAGVLAVQTAGKTQLYQKGLLGTFGLSLKIAGDFGKKQAAWEVGKSALRGVTRFQVSEGLQENLQEGTNEFLIDYYADLYKNDVASWGKSFEEAVDSQLSKQGFKVFMMGAMTGMFVNPVVNTLQYAASNTGLTPDMKNHRDSVTRAIDLLNKFYSGDSKNILKEQVAQIKLQSMYNDGMVEGLTSGDKYQYINNKDSALIQMVLTAKKTGTLEYLNSFIEGYGQNFTEKEFEEAFGYSPKELGKSSPQDVMSEISKSVSRFSNIYDKYQTKFGLYLSIDDLIKDPAAKQRFEIKKAALLDHIATVAFAEAKGQQSMIRQRDILQRASSYESIGQSLASSWNTITDVEQIDDQMTLVKNEINVLSESPQTPETKALIDKKQQEIDYLGLLKLIMYTPTSDAAGGLLWNLNRGILDNPNQRTAVVQLISEYLKIKNDQNGIKNPISNEEVDKALRDIFDYITLGRDHAEYVEAVNFLNDPDKMGNHFAGLMDARAGAHARLIYDDYMRLGSISSVAQKWIESDEQKKILDEIKQFSKQPKYSFQNYQILMDLIKKLDDKKAQFEGEVKLEREAEQKKQEEEIAAKTKASEESKKAIDIFQLYENPATRAEALEYMAMRYDLDLLRTSFPYGSENPDERRVIRYYIGFNGEKTAFPNQMRIPTNYDGMMYDAEGKPIIDETTGEFAFGTNKIDSYDALLIYLMEMEYAAFVENSQEAGIQVTPVETVNTLNQIDQEKSKLVNYVGSAIVLNGAVGTLEIVNDQFVIRYSDGTTGLIANYSDDLAFDDFQDLSIAHTQQPAENAGIVTNSPKAVVDTQKSGVVTLEMSMNNLNQVKINDVVWSIDRNSDGKIIGFNRSYEVKRGKKTKRIVEKMYYTDPKVQDYISRVNNFIMTVEPLPDNIEDAADQIEVLDNAIAISIEQIENEESRQMRSSEILSQYQLNTLVEASRTPEIAFLAYQWLNSDTRADMSNDDLLKLFVWASDLRNKIKSKFTVYMGNKVVEGYMNELIQEYINPISEIIDADGTKAEKPKRATRRSSKKEASVEKLIKDAKSRKDKRDTGGVPKGTERQKGQKRNVKNAVEGIQKKAEKKREKKSKRKVEKPSADRSQFAPLGYGRRRINKIAAKKISIIESIISGSSATSAIEPSSDNPFDSLKPACDV